MAVLTVKMLDAVTVPTIGSTFQITANKKTFQISIIGTATVSIEASNDGLVFDNLFPIVSLPALLIDESPYKFYRANAIVVSPGSIVTITLGFFT